MPPGGDAGAAGTGAGAGADATTGTTTTTAAPSAAPSAGAATDVSDGSPVRANRDGNGQGSATDRSDQQIASKAGTKGDDGDAAMMHSGKRGDAPDPRSDNSTAMRQ